MPSAKPPDNFYAVLGCRRHASIDELKTAFHRLALQAHPDKVAGTSGKDVRDFAEIYKAFSTLRDPEARAAYDAQFVGRVPPTPPASTEATAEPPPADEASAPERRLFAIRAKGVRNWFYSTLAADTKTAVQRRFRGMPQACIRAVVELADELLKNGVREPPETVSQPEADQAEPNADHLSTAGGTPSAGAQKGIHFTSKLGNLEAQIGMQGLQARWRGKSWPNCVQAHELLVGLKVAFGAFIRKDGTTFEKAVLGAVAKVTDEDNDGWPLPFQWAICKHHAGKRYHSPWFFEATHALKVRQMQYSAVVHLEASAKAMQKYHDDVAALQRSLIPNLAPMRVARVGREARALIVESPAEKAKADECRRPRYRLRGKHPAWRYWTPLRRMRPALLNDQPPKKGLHCQADPGKPLCLTDVAVTLDMPWFNAFAQSRLFSADERRRVLSHMSACPRVVRYLKKKAVEASTAFQVEDIRREKHALPWQFTDPLAVLPRDGVFMACLGLQQIFRLATVSRAARALVKESAPAFCSHVSFQPELLDLIRPTSAIPHLRRNTGTKDMAAKRFLSFLGTWYPIHHTRHVDLSSAPPAVKGSDELVTVLRGLRRLESVRTGACDWPDFRRINVLRQHLAQRKVACHVYQGESQRPQRDCVL